MSIDNSNSNTEYMSMFSSENIYLREVLLEMFKE